MTRFLFRIFFISASISSGRLSQTQPRPRPATRNTFSPVCSHGSETATANSQPPQIASCGILPTRPKTTISDSPRIRRTDRLIYTVSGSGHLTLLSIRRVAKTLPAPRQTAPLTRMFQSAISQRSQIKTCRLNMPPIRRPVTQSPPRMLSEMRVCGPQ